MATRAQSERNKKFKRLNHLRDIMISKQEAAERYRDEGDEELARRFLFEAQNLKKEVDVLRAELRPRAKAKYIVKQVTL